ARGSGVSCLGCGTASEGLVSWSGSGLIGGEAYCSIADDRIAPDSSAAAQFVAGTQLRAVADHDPVEHGTRTDPRPAPDNRVTHHGPGLDVRTLADDRAGDLGAGGDAGLSADGATAADLRVGVEARARKHERVGQIGA